MPAIPGVDAQRIVDAARPLHIDVVPSLDMPGHLGRVLSRHPELRLPAVNEPDALVRSENALDIARDKALDFARMGAHPTLAAAAAPPGTALARPDSTCSPGS